MEMVNGYIFLDLTKANVYQKALKVLTADKPVVIKDGGGSPYFVDSMGVDGTNVVITKGGKTITIANDNTITNVGDIQPHLYKCMAFDNCMIDNGDFDRGTWSFVGTQKAINIYNEMKEQYNELTSTQIADYMRALLDEVGEIILSYADGDSEAKGYYRYYKNGDTYSYTFNDNGSYEYSTITNTTFYNGGNVNSLTIVQLF